MKLSEIYNELGLSAANYNRWAKNFLKDYEIGVDYRIFSTKYSKNEYILKPYVAILALNSYLDATDRITKDFIKLYCSTLEDDNSIKILAEGLDFTDDFDYKYFIDQITRLANVSRDIPPHYLMPSECGIPYKLLREHGVLDENNNLTEEGKKVAKPRIILQARGESKIHVILKREFVDSLNFSEDAQPKRLEETTSTETYDV